MCKYITCTYILNLICLGIFCESSALPIASLRIHVSENPVSSQGAFVCLGYRPHIFAQVFHVAEDHLYLCPCGSREHVLTGRISLILSHDIQGQYLCKLSGLGYLCSLSGQNGQIYPGDSCTSPCRIISFFRLNPLPPSDLAQPWTGQ